MSDLDACFSDNIVCNPTEDLKYDLKSRTLNTNDVPFVKNRNIYKKDAYDEMLSLDTVLLQNGNEDRMRVPFRVFINRLI